MSSTVSDPSSSVCLESSQGWSLLPWFHTLDGVWESISLCMLRVVIWVNVQLVVQIRKCIIQWHNIAVCQDDVRCMPPLDMHIQLLRRRACFSRKAIGCHQQTGRVVDSARATTHAPGTATGQSDKALAVCTRDGSTAVSNIGRYMSRAMGRVLSCSRDSDS